MYLQFFFSHLLYTINTNINVGTASPQKKKSQDKYHHHGMQLDQKKMSEVMPKMWPKFQINCI